MSEHDVERFFRSTLSGKFRPYDYTVRGQIDFSQIQPVIENLTEDAVSNGGTNSKLVLEEERQVFNLTHRQLQILSIEQGNGWQL